MLKLLGLLSVLETMDLAGLFESCQAAFETLEPVLPQ